MIPSRPTPLFAHHIECLKKFADFAITLEELRRCLKELMDFDFNSENSARWMETRFEIPVPGVLVTKQHIEEALSKRRQGIITEQELIEWATMILHNHAYELDEKDEDIIAEWLNDISFDLHPFPE